MEANLAKPTEPTAPRRLGYTRASVVDADPRTQVEALIHAGVAPGDIYYEKAAGTARRKQYAALLKEARPGDIVVVWKLTRLGRTIREILETFQAFAERGVGIRVLSQPSVDTSTAAAPLIVAVLAAVAEMDGELTRERTLAGLAAARGRGHAGGRKGTLTLENLKDARKRIDQGEGGNAVAQSYKVSRAALYKGFQRYGLEAKPR